VRLCGCASVGRANPERAGSRLSTSLRPGRPRRGFPEAHEQTDVPTHQCAIASNTNVIPESATADIRDLVRWCPARRPCESPACEVPALRFATAGTTAPRFPGSTRTDRRTDASMRHCLQYQCHPGIGDSRYPGSRTLVPGTTAVRISSVRGPGSPLRYGRDDSAEVSRKHTNRPTHRRINAPLPPIPMSSRNRRQAISGISYAGARHDGRANLQRARSRLSASLRPGRQDRCMRKSYGRTDAPTHRLLSSVSTYFL
jgi:hypothetical protein